ncbi:MAG: PAS domain-containing sensor histidine kinase [Anaerolinea sp.]|nr:PAS domain-containing sensor histidine kinase [Anaerolinea sp.]
MFRSIRWKILLPFALLIILAMSLLGILLSNYVRQIYLEDLEDKQTAEALLIAEALKLAEVPTGIMIDLDDAASEWAKVLDARITIIAADGRVTGESHEDRAKMTNHLDRPEVQLAKAKGSGSSIRFSHTVGYHMMYTAIATYQDGQLSGFVRMAVPLNKIENKIYTLQMVITISILIFTLLAILLSIVISFRISQPLRELTRAVKGIFPGETVSTDMQYKGDEIAQLTHSFNAMSRQIETQIGEIESERARLASVLEKMTDGVLIVDEVGRVQLINPAAETMFGWHSGPVKGIPLVEVTQDYQSVELFRKCAQSGNSQSAKFELGNQKIHLQAAATQLGQSLPGYILLLFQDISRQVHVDNMRRDFISNVSHELRTPLAGIKALTETLQDGALEDPPAARRFLERIENEVDSLNLMVAELLELSRIESGKVPLEIIKTTVVDIIQPAFNRLHIQAERSEIEMDIDCPDNLPEILADANRLQQVIVNLLHNAIKYTPKGGKIILSARLVDQFVEFMVKDTGKGIPASDLPRIFERFYKIDRSRSSSGTGLGLAIARHLVDAHKGRIWAESEVGRGSIFRFTIPIA